MRRTGLPAKNSQDLSGLSPWPIAKRSDRGAIAIAVASAMTICPATTVAQGRPSAETLARIETDIRVAPDAACKIPQTDLERWLTEYVNEEGLMDNISRTVFHRELSAPPQSGYAALLAQVDEESRQIAARNRATYKALETGEQAPVGQQLPPAPPHYHARLVDVQALARIENGLNCGANIQVDFLRFPIKYTLTLDPNQSDGWASQPTVPPMTEAHALADQSALRVVYQGSELTLAQARQQSEIDSANQNAATETARQQELAEEAYRNSPAGRAAAVAETRALSAEYKRRGLACQNSGGTWGIKWDNNTILEVTPGDVPGEIARFTLGCYHL